MDPVLSTVSAPQPIPQTQTDVRPAADAAALARDPNPHVSLAIPASLGQTGAVTETRMTEARLALEAQKPTERVLKPFGIAMLPSTPADGDPKTAVTATEDADTTAQEA